MNNYCTQSPWTYFGGRAELKKVLRRSGSKSWWSSCSWVFYTNDLYSTNCKVIQTYSVFELWGITILCYKHKKGNIDKLSYFHRTYGLKRYPNILWIVSCLVCSWGKPGVGTECQVTECQVHWVPSGLSAKCDWVPSGLSAKYDWVPSGPSAKYDRVPSVTECQVWPSAKWTYVRLG